MLRFIITLFSFPAALFATESVFCVHGFMRSPDSMQPIATAFLRKGYEAHSWGYPSRERSIEEHARFLVEELQAAAARNPNDPIHFVTHSLGGVIVRAALNHPDCPQEAKVGKAVLLVPPNRGSQYAKNLSHIKPLKQFFGAKAGHELLTQENFDYLGQFPESKKVLVISGTCGCNLFVSEWNDGKVGIRESCLETPHEHILVFAGHSWIMYSDSVIDRVVDFIDGK